MIEIMYDPEQEFNGNKFRKSLIEKQQGIIQAKHIR